MRPVFRIALNRYRGYHRVVTGLLLTAFVVTAAGIPLPKGGKFNKTDGRFLCATSSCGCATAEQCWRSCCCHTLPERLAWARANGVRPPEFAIAQARAAGHDLSWVDGRDETKVKLACRSHSCCEKERDTAEPERLRYIARPSRPAAHSCCSTKRSEEPQHAVIAWQALKCGGHSMNWLAAVPTLVNVRADFALKIAPPTWLSPPASDRAFGTTALPAVPPPERA